ncbi:hypothetical protein Gohar_008899 [Gossypium harknessii]|uniref:Uncharacterized protein n=1 Tax=Gossypium harknessii TaxID=34285 RepID=A0A7J9GMI2_9ROSI|nr:hypothetical protein [Gossypium harknessii]
MWQRRYDYLPMREPFLIPNLATSLDYMDWFRHNGKSYLLSTVEISRKHHRNRPRRGPINPRLVEHAKGDQYLLQVHTRTRLSCNLPVNTIRGHKDSGLSVMLKQGASMSQHSEKVPKKSSLPSMSQHKQRVSQHRHDVGN